MNIRLFFNFDIIAISLTVVVGVILGFIIYLRDRQSATHRLFFIFTLINAVWAIINYFSYQIVDPGTSLWLVRLVVFIAVWHAFTFLLFVRTFPERTIALRAPFFYYSLVIAAGVSLLTLSPIVFPRVEIGSRQVPQPVVAPGVVFFGAAVFFFIGSGIAGLVRKINHAAEGEKPALEIILLGFALTFLSILVLNFIFPVIFSESSFVSLSGVVTLPFMVMTAYAIVRYGLLDIKIISTEVVVTLALASTLIELAIAQTMTEIFLRGAVVGLLLCLSIVLIRSVFGEVQQRQKLEVLTGQLETANAKLIDLDRLKSQFLSFASHQLKGPLAAIRLVAQLLTRGQYGILAPPVKDRVGKISESADRLITMTDNFLDLRKIEEGRMEYQLKPVDLVALLKDIVDKFQPLAAAKHLALTLQSALTTAVVTADQEKLREVFENLIDNALKYTPQGSVSVSIADQPSRRSAAVSVRDSGMGIDPVTLPDLFEQFKRDRNARSIQGTGLGLYIAKRIISDMKGTIRAESTGIGQGSVFTVELPKARG